VRVVTSKNSTGASDPRVRRTQAALQQTLMHLVEERDLSQISVALVAERAEVSRSTFYDHYTDVHQLAEAACTAMIDELVDALPTGPDWANEDETGSLRAFFTSLAEHAGLYRSLLGPQGSARVIDHIRRRIAAAVHRAVREVESGPAPESDPEADRAHDVPAVFTAGALIGVATDWLQGGCAQTPDEMAAVTWPMLTAHYRAAERA
jgi:AcrR family transcriptional regulator